MNSSYLSSYINTLKELISNNSNLELIKKLTLILKKLKKKNKVIIFGNGGSSAIASHFITDMSKNTNVKCIGLTDISLITCLTNDYGYENLNKKYIEYYGTQGDVLIAISSSGESKNIINACRKAKKLKFKKIITLTGFKKNNTLSKMGNINFWVNSKNYNLVENTHQIYLLSCIDMLKKKKF